MIYFIQAEDGGAIKIGTTVRLSKRLKQLGKGSDQSLRVLAVVDGGPDEEQRLHEQFAHLCMGGEWFDSADDLVSFIRRVGQSWDGSNEVSLRHARLELSAEDYDRLKLAAQRDDRSITNYVRQAVLRQIRRDLDGKEGDE